MRVIKRTHINLTKNIADIKNIKAQVGFFDSAKYEDGTPVAVIAQQNEYGNLNKNIPPRPFMRPARDDNKSAWGKIAMQGTKQVLEGKKNIKQVFDLLALKVEGDIKIAIKQVTKPSLKESTVRARLRGKNQGKSVSLTVAKPLIDTGYMLASVTHEVSQ